MPSTDKKVKVAMQEGRLMVLGATILLGFQYRSFLEPGFDRLSASSQGLRLVSLALMLLSILLLKWPVTFHEVVETGNLTPRLLGFTEVVPEIACVPFAIAMGIDVYTMTDKANGHAMGLAAGIGTTILAALF